MLELEGPPAVVTAAKTLRRTCNDYLELVEGDRLASRAWHAFHAAVDDIVGRRNWPASGVELQAVGPRGDGVGVDVAECIAERSEEAVGETGGEVLYRECHGGEAHGLLFV